MSASKDVAQKGIKLIENISHLCGNLLEPTIGTPQLEKFIDEVMPQAQDAQRQSTHVKMNFQVIMVTFIEVGRWRYIMICGVFIEDFGKLFPQISKDIPMTVEKIEGERDQALTAASQSLIIFKAWHRILGPPAPAQVEGNISLPFPLPLVSLVRGAIETKMVNVIESASNPELSFSDSQMQFQRGIPASLALRKPLPC